MSVFHFVLLRFTFAVMHVNSVGHEAEASQDFGVNSPDSDISPINSDVDMNGAGRPNVQGRDVLELALEDYSQQVSDLQKQLREVRIQND